MSLFHKYLCACNWPGRCLWLYYISGIFLTCKCGCPSRQPCLLQISTDTSQDLRTTWIGFSQPMLFLFLLHERLVGVHFSIPVSIIRIRYSYEWEGGTKPRSDVKKWIRITVIAMYRNTDNIQGD